MSVWGAVFDQEGEIACLAPVLSSHHYTLSVVSNRPHYHTFHGERERSTLVGLGHSALAADRLDAFT